jgi:hypothetical protein
MDGLVDSHFGLLPELIMLDVINDIRYYRSCDKELREPDIRGNLADREDPELSPS